MQTVLLARHAMATRFEIVLHGNEPVGLRAAGEEALDEVERIERTLSLYEPTSEIANINARAAHEAVRVSPEVFNLLAHARSLSEASAGAFDITIGPLMGCWGLRGKQGRVPGPEELAEVRQQIGMHRLCLDADTVTVRFESEGMMLDLGAIGKGYAIDRAVEILREAGVRNAFLHGGTSTAYGLGIQPNGDGWKVVIDSPQHLLMPYAENEATVRTKPPENRAEREILATVELVNEALSVSAPTGKFFKVNERAYGHVLDPRTAQPVTGAAISAVVLPSATESDALSTALLALGRDGHDIIASARPRARLLVAESDKPGDALRVRSHGFIVAGST